MTYFRQLKVPKTEDVETVAAYSEKSLDELIEYINDLEAQVISIAQQTGSAIQQLQGAIPESVDIPQGPTLSEPYVVEGSWNNPAIPQRSSLDYSKFETKVELAGKRALTVTWTGYAYQGNSTASDYYFALGYRKVPSTAYTSMEATGVGTRTSGMISTGMTRISFSIVNPIVLTEGIYYFSMGMRSGAADPGFLVGQMKILVN